MSRVSRLDTFDNTEVIASEGELVKVHFSLPAFNLTHSRKTRSTVMTASNSSTSVEHHKLEASSPALASSNPSKLLEQLPPRIRAKIFSYITPQEVKLEFLGSDPAKWPKKPSTLPLLQGLPSFADEISTQVFSQTQFNFKSSTFRKGPVVHGCEVALAFLNHIKPANVGHIRMITCDLNWHNKESVNMLLQMLAKLATYPSRNINHVRFEFEAAPGAKRSKKGIVAKTFGFTLKGLVGLKMTIFVLGLNHLPNADEFALRMNRWFQRHHKLASTPVNYFGKLPPEVTRLIYRCLPLEPTYHRIEPAIVDRVVLRTAPADHDIHVLPSSSFDLLLVNRQMYEEILPVVFSKISFEFVALSTWRHQRKESRDKTDEASWITSIMNGLGGNAKFIKKARIVFEIYSPHSHDYAKQYTPSIKAIMDKIDECFNFQLTDGYRTLPNDEIPIVSVTWSDDIRRRCFLIRLPTRGNTELMVEVQTDFSYEAPGSLAYDSQVQVVREGYKHSINGMRFKIDYFGTIIPA